MLQRYIFSTPKPRESLSQGESELEASTFCDLHPYTRTHLPSSLTPSEGSRPINIEPSSSSLTLHLGLKAIATLRVTHGDQHSFVQGLKAYAPPLGYMHATHLHGSCRFCLVTSLSLYFAVPFTLILLCPRHTHKQIQSELRSMSWKGQGF